MEGRQSEILFIEANRERQISNKKQFHLITRPPREFGYAHPWHDSALVFCRAPQMNRVLLELEVEEERVRKLNREMLLLRHENEALQEELNRLYNEAASLDSEILHAEAELNRENARVLALKNDEEEGLKTITRLSDEISLARRTGKSCATTQAAQLHIHSQTTPTTTTTSTATPTTVRSGGYFEPFIPWTKKTATAGSVRAVRL